MMRWALSGRRTWAAGTIFVLLALWLVSPAVPGWANPLVAADDDPPPEVAPEEPAADDPPPEEEPPAEEPPAEEPPAEEPPAEEPPADEDNPAPAEGEEPAADDDSASPPAEADDPPPEQGEMPAEEAPAEDSPPAANSGKPDQLPADEAGTPAPLKGEDARPGPKRDEPGIGDVGFEGVRPGHTTADELHEKWGQPTQIEKVAGGMRETYALESWGEAKVMVAEDEVSSVAIRLNKTLTLDEMTARLAVGDSQAVEIYDESGAVLGQVFPEHGVLMAFMPNSRSRRVFQLVIEPITAEPFMARAEKRLQNQYTDCLTDLKKVLSLAPESSRAHWLHAELTMRAGALEPSLQSAQKAVRLDPKKPEYRLTLARVLAASSDYAQAIEQVRGIIEWGKAPPVVAAQAWCLWGDFVAASHERDYQQAMKYHLQAIKLAEPVAGSGKFVVRRAAKQVLVDAHLGVAHDIGWGRWQQKAKIVPKWLDHANAFADNLIADEHGSNETRLRVYQGALSALAGVAEPPDATKWIRATQELARLMIDDSHDEAYKARLSWDVAVALLDAVEIEGARRHGEQALALGQTALAYFEKGDQAGKQLPTHDFLRGRLHYRLGAIHAIENQNHSQAISWFDRAVPLLESPVPAVVMDSGKQGETFVSIAVSYWESKNYREAMRLTRQGVKLMEQAAGEGLMSKAALAVPYGNLASMHEQLGEFKEAKRFSDLATRYEQVRAK